MSCHTFKCNILFCFSPKATDPKSYRKDLRMLAAVMWHTLLKIQEVWAEIRKGPERFAPWRAGGDRK